MATYTVHEPPNPEADRLDRADELQFVKDGFSWTTAFFPPLGFALQRLWLAALGYLVLASLAFWLLAKAGLTNSQISIAVMALNLYLGFEVSSLKRWSLDRKGWQTIGTVTGRNLVDCERRFLESWLPAQPVITSRKAESPAVPSRWPAIAWGSAPRSR